METKAINRSQIKGWGIDADPHNDPTYPIKKRTNREQSGYSWERPPLQPADVEVLHSNERPNLSATFGTGEPPSRLSGIIRRLAFRYSESSYGHWLPLLLADRVSMIEGFVDDLRRGHVPNVFAERGWKAEWKYNRKRLMTWIIVGSALITASLAYLNSRRTNSHRLK